MIRNRMEGFVALHGLATFAILVGNFHLTIGFFNGTGLIELNRDINFRLYQLGIAIASLFIHRHLRGLVTRYGRLHRREVVHLTLHQMMRLMLVVFGLAFVTKDTAVSRAFLLVFIAVSAGLLLLANLALPRVLVFAFLRNWVQRTVIVADATAAVRLHAWLCRHAAPGCDLIGYVSDCPGPAHPRLSWLARPADLVALVDRERIDQVFLARTTLSREDGRELVAACEQLGCRVRSFIDILSLLPSPGAAFEHDGQYAFATVTPEPLDNPVNRLAKRALDIAVALPVMLIVLPPVLAVAKAFQIAQSPGPLMYRQVRSGIGRRRFLIFKIRTMHVRPENVAAQQAVRGDARIYPFGAFLRRTSLDELPQFLNVLSGEMSVSGPRPHLLEHDELFARSIGTYRKRHFVKPGITGLAQIKGFRGEVSRPTAIMKRVRYDMHYIRKWSLLLDVRIILNTVRQIVFPPKTAY